MANGEDGGSQPGRPRTLYANLMEQNGSASGQTISRAPVMFKQSETQQAENATKQNAALRFQPTKRPQVQQKQRPKSSVPRSQSSLPSTSSPASLQKTSNPVQSQHTGPRTTLADWTGDDDDIDGFYVGEKRQRGGRKKRKKNKEEAPAIQDWDDVYDPSRPNNYADYKNSEERYREIRDWKDRLYSHRIKRHDSSDFSEEDTHTRPVMNKAFAPPSNYSFAPPPAFDDDSPQQEVKAEDSVPADVPSAEVPNDASGEDAFARRLRMSQNLPAASASHISPSSSPPSLPPPPPPPAAVDAAEPIPGPPPNQPPPTISRAPVRYQLPPVPDDTLAAGTQPEVGAQDLDEGDEADVMSDVQPEDMPKSSRPGQKGFAERLMSKYGWTKGSGLGASGTGIVNPLRVQVEKRKKKSDAQGGGWVGPAGKGKIIASKHGKGTGDAGEGQGMEVGLSEVIVLHGMVDGLDLDKELGEGNLMQEIGEECGDKYGRVERVFIDRHSASSSMPVFIKFTSQLSALRAVQALSGRNFNGNTIQARYFEAEKFEAGIYE